MAPPGDVNRRSEFPAVAEKRSGYAAYGLMAGERPLAPPMAGAKMHPSFRVTPDRKSVMPVLIGRDEREPEHGPYVFFMRNASQIRSGLLPKFFLLAVAFFPASVQLNT